MAPDKPGDDDSDEFSRTDYQELIQATETPREEALLRIREETGLRAGEFSRVMLEDLDNSTK